MRCQAEVGRNGRACQLGWSGLTEVRVSAVAAGAVADAGRGGAEAK
ncbi:hypothetical protein [Goodfellowiella coeruleoviolacea]|uniref:Uncharacterized protein n=1 Tax=Goodfellowiella coeruleoviolacea TaxID=334858 RepID=A0AAE3GJW2_9PSEU|nr:hypothetical protein [Goodfellowiella coeruleoviolacea]MCP2168747.1 hypothetical protein [Goodfellowiella coeruleoviolacea]